MDNTEEKPSPEIRELYPYMTDEQLIESEKNLIALAELLWHMLERIEQEKSEKAQIEQYFKIGKNGKSD